MKNKILGNLTTFAVAAVLSVAALENSALGQGCCLTYPANTPLNAFVTGYPNWFVPVGDPDPQHGFTTPPSWFAVDVIDTNAPILSGIYPAWCVDQTHFLPVILTTIPGTYYSGTLISTCDALGLAYLPAHGGTPPVGPPPTVTLATWHQVNYILNHKTGYYWWNVQVAISRLVGGLAPNDPLNPPPLPANFPPVDTNEVNAILNDVNANAAAWTSPCGGIVGVIYVIPDPTFGNPAQLIMLEVPCVCPLTANCVSINAVQGVAITPATMVGSGGCGGPYTFSATGLPAALTMSSGGTISGTPTVSGTFNYTVTITDNCGNQGTFNCSVTVNSPPTANCVTINAVKSVAITPVTMVGSGGCGGPYTFSATNLPAGLTMSSGGTISGTPTVSGTFNYKVTITDKCGNKGTVNCSVTVNPPPTTLVSGDAATIGFWHNQNGQALILSLNGGGSSTKLGNWLAANFPCLYGNLAGKQNSVVAAQFLTFFNVTGQKTYAQVMAGALAAYATSSTLAGGNMAAGYGFNVSSAGTGAKTYNVGSNGTAIGLLNNTAYTALQLLQAANAKCPFSAAAFDALNTIFDGINTKGDIK